MKPLQARRGTLRNRLLFSFVLVAAGALTLAGTSTAYFINRGAEQSATDEIRHKADNIAAVSANIVERMQAPGSAKATRQTLGIAAFLNQLRATARVADARVVFMSNGKVLTYAELNAVGRRDPRREQVLVGAEIGAEALVALPDGITAADLQLREVAKGATSTLRRNDTAYLAASIDIPALRFAVPIVILSEPIDRAGVRRATTAFLFSAVVALGACVMIAAWLSRRLTRPLLAIEAAAYSLAAGDLSARVHVDADADRELADVAMTMNRLAHDLDVARNAERSFLQAVSHDLRTPLTSIRGYSEALADGTIDTTDPVASKRAAEVITAEANRLERLVRDLLDLSRLESREFTLRAQPCDAVEVVSTIVEAFQPRAEASSLVLDFNATHTTVACDLDPERLGQAVANLVENALKYAQHHVNVTLTHRADLVVVDVVDDGPGIGERERVKVFERLYTSRKTPGRAVGTGLGLTIVAELANAMGGTCTLLDDHEKGAAFRLQVRTGTAAVKSS